MNTILQDVRYGLRILAKNPTFTAAAVITMALGIGVNTAIFSLLHGTRMIPQRLQDPEELVFLWTPDEYSPRGAVSALDYLDWRDQATSFEELAAFGRTERIVTGGGEPEKVDALLVSSGLLPMLGFRAQVGRLHDAGEDSLAAEPVVVLTDRFWQRRFGRNTGALGQSLGLNGKPHTIIGVLPPEAEIERLWFHADLLVPLKIDPGKAGRDERWLTAMARLAPGVAVEQAQAEMSAIAAGLAAAYPDTNDRSEAWVQPLLDRFLPLEERLMEKAVLAAVGAVLLIACFNLANLLLAKASGRSGEFAIRAALGAGRGRIVRQLLTESVLLALAGGILGVFLAAWAVDLFLAGGDALAVQRSEVGLNAAVLTYAFLLSLATALVFGLAPALAASKASVGETLKEGGLHTSAGRSQHRLRNALVVTQLAVALPLAVCCGLATRHIAALKSSAVIGFEPEGLLTVKIALPPHRYGEEARRAAFYRGALETIEALPGITAAGATLSLPFGGDRLAHGPFTVEGRVTDGSFDRDTNGYQVATPNYFRTMGITLIRGRFFSDLDHPEAAKVAIINQHMARKYWPDQDAVGKRVSFTQNAQWTTIVGVVSDAGCAMMGQPPRPILYLPHSQKPSWSMFVVARTQGDPSAAVPAVRSAIHAIDQDIPIYDFRTVDAILHQWLRDDRLLAGFLGALAALAVGLAAVGLYGMMSYSVVQRTREIGVRMAMGAGKETILRMVLRRCLRLSIVGILAGLVISVPAGLTLASWLYGVGGTDPVTLLGVPALLLVVAAAAGYLPARRATRVDPMTALRCE